MLNEINTFVRQLKNSLKLLITGVIILLFFPVQSFCQIANGQSKFLGNIIGTYIPHDFTKYWNQVSPENSGKWGEVEVKQDVYNWSELDTIYNYAIKNKIPFKFHNLIWGKQQPEWIKNLDSTDQRKQVEEWIRLCGERYPKASFVDVVNEPIKTSYDTLYPPYYKAIGGAGKTDWDWVIWSFKEARKYFPHSKLLLNEYNIFNGRKPIDTFTQIIKLLKERDLIDGIGCQAHFLEKTDSSMIRKKLDRLTKLGLPIYISEYDVNIADDAEQLAKYKEQFPLFWDNPTVKGITFWGYVQNIIWRPNAYLVRANGSERPALKWLNRYVNNSVNNKK